MIGVILSLLALLIKILFYLFALTVFLLVFSKVYVELVKGICTCTERIDGKTVLITGGNAGIGYETAKRLAKHGARVVIASRNLEKSKKAAKNLSDLTGNPNIEARALDLSNIASIKQFADDFNKTYDRLDILINNAGFSQFEHVFTESGVEMIMQVNHVGPAYLTYLLLDKLIASKPARIIFVGSGLYQIHKFDPNDLLGKKPYNLWIRYGNSKLCNILSTIALSKRLPEGVTVNTLHPGTTDSEIWERIPYEIPRKITYALLGFVCRTVEECAQTSIHSALSPSLENVTGKYIEECKISSLKRVPPPGECEKLAERVWDDTIKLAEDILHNKKDA